MSSFLKTSFIHDETAPGKSLVLLLKRSFSRQHHLHLLVLLVATVSALHERDELVRPCTSRPAPGRFAKTGQARLWSIHLHLIYRGLSSDRAGRLRSIRPSKVSSKSIFLFCRKCAICDFPSETSATPSPVSKCVTFGKKLRTYEMLPKTASKCFLVLSVDLLCWNFGFLCRQCMHSFGQIGYREFRGCFSVKFLVLF